MNLFTKVILGAGASIVIFELGEYTMKRKLIRILKSDEFKEEFCKIFKEGFDEFLEEIEPKRE